MIARHATLILLQNPRRNLYGPILGKLYYYMRFPRFCQVQNHIHIIDENGEKVIKEFKEKAEKDNSEATQDKKDNKEETTIAQEEQTTLETEEDELLEEAA